MKKDSKIKTKGINELVNEFVAKHGPKPQSKKDQKSAQDIKKRNSAFLEKWKHRLIGPPRDLSDGTIYGDSWVTDGNGSFIDLSGIPPSWYDVLDETLTEIERQHPHFRIMQLKNKFDTVRIHLANVPRTEMKKIKAKLNRRLKK